VAEKVAFHKLSKKGEGSQTWEKNLKPISESSWRNARGTSGEAAALALTLTQGRRGCPQPCRHSEVLLHRWKGQALLWLGAEGSLLAGAEFSLEGDCVPCERCDVL